MPGFRPRRDPLLRLASSANRRAAVGTGSVGVAGVRRAADISPGSGSTLGIVGELHQIDSFDVSDDTASTFTLTKLPIQDSWNPSLNGVMLRESVDYTISGRVLYVTDPTDLFLGADDQATPWQLRVQYDYLVGMPAPAVVAEDVYHDSASSPLDMDFGSEASESSVIVMAVISGGTHTFTGRGSWTLVSTHTYQSRTTKVYIGYDFGGAGTQVNLATSSGAGAIGYLFDKGTTHTTIPTYTLGVWTDTFAGDGATGSVASSSGQSIAAFCGGPLSPAGLVGRTDTGVTLGASTLEEGNTGTFIAGAAGDSTGGSVSTVFDLNPYGGVGVMGLIMAVSV